MLIELEGHSNLGAVLGLDGLGYEDTVVDQERFGGTGRLRARQISPDDALADYLDRAGLGVVSRRLITAGAMEVVTTAAPGIRDLLSLGKIRQLEQAEAADLIVVDAPAAGHALTFLNAAAGLADSSSAGPVREQADLVLEMFADDDRCQVVLVTLAEETPVSETVETAFSLEERVGLKLGPVVVNGLWPDIDGLAEAADAIKSRRSGGVLAARRAAEHRIDRVTAQRVEVDRLAAELPLAQIHLPFLFGQGMGPDELCELATVLADGPVGGG